MILLWWLKASTCLLTTWRKKSRVVFAAQHVNPKS